MWLGFSGEENKAGCGEQRARESLGVRLGFRPLGQGLLSITYVPLQKKMMHSKAGMGLEQVHVSCSTKPNVISLYNLSYVCAFNKPTLQKINRFVLLKLAHKGLEEKKPSLTALGDWKVTSHSSFMWGLVSTIGQETRESHPRLWEIWLWVWMVWGQRASRPAGGSQAPVTRMEFDSWIHSLSASSSALRF